MMTTIVAVMKAKQVQNNKDDPNDMANSSSIAG